MNTMYTSISNRGPASILMHLIIFLSFQLSFHPILIHSVQAVLCPRWRSLPLRYRLLLYHGISIHLCGSPIPPLSYSSTRHLSPNSFICPPSRILARVEVNGDPTDPRSCSPYFRHDTGRRDWFWDLGMRVRSESVFQGSSTTEEGP